MDIAVIGTGQVGGALGTGWARAGHRVIFGARAPQDPALAARLAATAPLTETPARAARPAEAAAAAGVVVLALPWPAAEAAVAALGDLAGKIVIDCMNPLAMHGGALGLDRGFETSGAETVAAWLPAARVVKTLNQTGAETLADARSYAHRPVMFVAADDAQAREVASGLVTDLGFEALDAGGLRAARLLEPFAMVWIDQAMFRGKGRGWAFAALPRQAAAEG